MIKFIIGPASGASAIVRRHYYCAGDHSFIFGDIHALSDPGDELARSGSLVVGTLQLLYRTDTGEMICCWGYCPVSSWNRVGLTEPEAALGSIVVVLSDPVPPGAAKAVDTIVPPRYWYDPHTGLFCVGNPLVPAGATAIRFATDSIAVVRAERLLSVWVRPSNTKDINRVLEKGGQS